MTKDGEKTGEKVVTLAAKPRRPCPICGRPAVKAHRPFCSLRCAEADLGNWVSGRYRVPTDEEPDDAFDGQANPSDLSDPSGRHDD